MLSRTRSHTFLGLVAFSVIACGAGEVTEDGLDELEELPSALTATLPVGATIQATTDVNVRSGPGKTHPVVAVVKAGSIVPVTRSASQNSYYAVAYRGVAGFTHGAYYTEVSGVPRGLACLPRWYGVDALKRNGVWSVRFPGGAVQPYDDGKAKTYDQKIAAPDLQDTLSMRYDTGPIVPVTAVNDDPGRIRSQPLFDATYGASESLVVSNLVTLSFRGQSVKVHKKVADRFRAVAARLDAAVAADPALKAYLNPLGGTYNRRFIAGTNRLSAHSWGMAMDVNVSYSNYWEWQVPKDPPVWKNRIPQAVVDAFEAEGFVWGGRWYHYDTMHFEYRPELLAAECR